MRGQSGAVGYNPSLGGTTNVAVVNQGTIQADVAGGTITVYGTGNQNAGTLNALNGATLSLQGTDWQDSGSTTRTRPARSRSALRSRTAGTPSR